MTARENLTTALGGGIPEHTPLSVLDWFFADPRYDGALCHVVEMLTEPPEWDLTLDECRAAWPDKVPWANINVGLYGLPSADLRQVIIAMRQRAGKKALAFAISEDIPENWRDTIPVVLQTLQELG